MRGGDGLTGSGADGEVRGLGGQGEGEEQDGGAEGHEGLDTAGVGFGVVMTLPLSVTYEKPTYED